MTADLQNLFDQAGRNPPSHVFDADAVLHRARRSRNRRTTIVVVATLTVTSALVVGLASQRGTSADPVPANPLPTVQALGSLGSLAYGINGDVYVANAEGKNPVKIADGAPSQEGYCGGYWGEGPIWSPDGRYLAYRGSGGEAIPNTCDRTVNISDSAGHRVASFPGDGWVIAWSPDSTRVAVWHDIYGINDGERRLEVYGLDGVRQAMLYMPSGWSLPGDYDPVWSPDGASLLVPGAEIPVDGSTPRLLTGDDPGSYGTARYSPSGAEIAYISPDGLIVAAADGSEARVLVPGGLRDFLAWPSALAWSPTGDRIAFVSQAGGASELAVVDVASGSVARLADTGDADALKYVRFSPEGDQILFGRYAAGKPSLWSVHTDGSNPHRLVGGTSWGDWQTLSQTR